MTARSPAAKVPNSEAACVLPSAVVTPMVDAPETTWLLVTTSPLSLKTTSRAQTEVGLNLHDRGTHPVHHADKTRSAGQWTAEPGPVQADVAVGDPRGAFVG